MRIIVVDASTLVSELVRSRGRHLLTRTDVRFVVAEDQWEETERALARRFDVLRTRLGEELVDALRSDIEPVTSMLEIHPSAGIRG